MPAPATESLPAIVRTARIPLLSKSEKVLIRKKIVLAQKLQSRSLRGLDDDFRLDAIFGIRAGAALALAVVVHADEPTGLQRPADVPQEHHRMLHLVKCIDDQHGINC